jgi:hypothetical protein
VNNIFRRAWRQIGAFVDDDPITVTDEDEAGEDALPFEGDDFPPIFIKGQYLGIRWERDVDNNLHMVLNVRGITPGSSEPITVDIGFEGWALEPVSQAFRRQYVQWLMYGRDGSMGEGDTDEGDNTLV